jgi:hypothetical protein
MSKNLQVFDRRHMKEARQPCVSADVAILLTGSIAPAVAFVALNDIAERRKQYLSALHFYRNFAPVYFLENSDYDVSRDPQFSDLSGVKIRKFEMLPDKGRGKGYQEFAMVDRWYDTEPTPPSRFLKITGRYILRNVVNLLAECRCAPKDTLLIDEYPGRRVALTSVFSADWKRYGQVMKGLYRQMDDSAGTWAEHVFYRALMREAGVQSFANEPDLAGISGSTGAALEDSRWKWAAKQISRTANRTITKRNIYFRG